jgi:hypothetical protein
MGRKTDGAGRRLQRMIARVKRQEEELPPDFIEFSEREMEALKFSELMEFGRRRPLTSAIEKAAQEFGLDPRRQADRDQLLEYFAEAHYGKRGGGRPTKIDGYVLSQDITMLGHLEPLEHLGHLEPLEHLEAFEQRGKTRASVIAKDLREKLPERYKQVGDRILRQRVTKLLKDYETLKALLKEYEEALKASSCKK